MKNILYLCIKEIKKDMIMENNNLAFIRLCNEEIIDKLIGIGYLAYPNKKSMLTNVDEHSCLATGYNSVVRIADWEFDSTNPHVTWNIAGRVDCGKDVDKFLKISSNLKDEEKFFYLK